MLALRVIMNSACEAVFGFKTCCGLKATDQNLEIQVVNNGKAPVTVPSFFDLESDDGVKRYEHLMPHGRHELQPGEIKAFYCYMDPVEWARARRIAMYDGDGRVYSVDLKIVE